MIRQFLHEFAQSSTSIKLVAIAVVMIWGMVLVTIVAASLLLLESPGAALPPTPGGAGGAAIFLEPASGGPGTLVTVQGEGWQPNGLVLIYLTAPGQTETPNYAAAGSTADAQGRFSAQLTIPAEPAWQTQGLAAVTARVAASGEAAQAFFNLIGASIPLTPTSPTETPAATVEPTATPTLVVQPTPGSSQPLATARTDLNVRGGPGTLYPVLGLLRAGQAAEITGISPDGGWWQIKFLGTAGERGWVATTYVTAQNTGNVPAVQAPPLPATATPTAPRPTATPAPTATPVVITDWRGEYYTNAGLSGSPALVRNDSAVNFEWGNGSPAAGMPADNFSARWTRRVDFDRGTYVVRVWVDDGVRLWVDDTLLIDSWKDGSPRLLEAERQISDGVHRVKVEYYERTSGAQIEVTWERVSTNRSPQAAPGGPYTVKEGSLVTFDGGGSRDPDGHVVKYEWDFSYDGRNFTADAAGSTAGARYPDGPATVTLALRVTDDDGATNLATAQVKVENAAPAVEAGGPYAGQAGSSISMAGTAADPGSADQPGLTYGWDFGDGAQGSGPLVSHSYAQAGSYTARLTVTDKDGAQGSDTATVQVGAVNQPPAAAISGPASGQTGQTLNFSASSSGDGDGHIVSYAWAFGDGATASGVDASHAYAQADDYQVTLTVTDDDGLTGSASHAVEISAANQPPAAVIGGPATAQVGQVVAFDAGGSSDPEGAPLTHAWDFGDGAIGSGQTITHTYQQTATYTVTLTVTDSGGLTDTATHPISVAAALDDD